MYCINVHNVENLVSLKKALELYTLEVKRLISPSKPYEVGLRLSNTSAKELLSSNELSDFKAYLKKNDLIVRHINAFPYGDFQGTIVKENAYLPDWSSPSRLDYTLNVISVLQELLNPGEVGSISTVPLGYKNLWSNEKLISAKNNLSIIEKHLESIDNKTNKKIILAIEPEPDCVIESSKEFIELLPPSKYIGVCFDTCHFAVVGEDLSEAIKRFQDSGIIIARVQISSAIKIKKESLCKKDLLCNFFDKNFLHQMRQGCNRFPDLNEETLNDLNSLNDVFIHYHIPLFFSGNSVISTTCENITYEFLRTIKKVSIPLEIETYTYSVLPKSLFDNSISSAIAKEELWLQDKLIRV